MAASLPALHVLLDVVHRSLGRLSSFCPCKAARGANVAKNSERGSSFKGGATCQSVCTSPSMEDAAFKANMCEIPVK